MDALPVPADICLMKNFHLKETLASLYLPGQDCFHFHIHCHLCPTWPGTYRELVVCITPADTCLLLLLITVTPETSCLFSIS